ncbi:MAG: PQQ-binding-like beta-propeller repeat protein [Candidatus Thermoplasmatota archaeon]
MKALITIAVAFLLLISFNIRISEGEASSTIYKNDGVWIDEFQNGTSLQKKNNVSIENDELKTIYESYNNSYDFASQTGHKAYYNLFVPLQETSEGIKPLFFRSMKDSFLEEEIGNYSLLEKEDDKKFSSQSTSVLTTSLTTMHHFTFRIEDKAKYIDNMSFHWKGETNNSSKIVVYSWRYSQDGFVKKAGMWEKIEEIETTESIEEIKYNLSGISKYLGADKTFDVMIAAIPEKMRTNCKLMTDYVNVSTETHDFYSVTGEAISEKIDPVSLGAQPGKWRWEKVFWDGDFKEDKATVRIQILNGSDLKPIDELSGNRDGFLQSPIDISDLSIDKYDSIALRAWFNNSDRTLTAKLKKWAVSWQTKSNCYKDDFQTLFRIDKTNGVNHNCSGFSVSQSADEWAVFGKDFDNNRVYFGEAPEEYNLYWNSENSSAGGLFCSPVVSDGRVFIPSSTRNKVLAFKVKQTEEDENQIPVDSTVTLPHKIEMSPAIVDDLLIVGTSGYESKNRVYAFDKNNLSMERWNWTIPSDENICFSSSHNVEDNKVYITSWSGSGLSSPYYNYFNNIIKENDLLNRYIDVEPTGRITVLNNSGELLWSKILPAASFSTPAIHEDKVIVGCENMNGDSLIAYDKETGRKVWDTTVGMIGKSSPMVFCDQIYVLTKKPAGVARWQDQLVVIDADNGEVQWRLSFGDKLFTPQTLPKNIIDYILPEEENSDSINALKIKDLMTATTPVFNDGMVYVASSNGELYSVDVEKRDVKWNLSLSNDKIAETAKRFNMPLHNVASPVVANGRVYAASSFGVIYAVDEETGEIIWNNSVEPEDYNIICSSPTVSDGLLFINSINSNFEWKLHAIGGYKKKIQGRAISEVVTIPRDGYWWSNFNADYETPGDSEISFSILNKQGATLLSDLSGGNNVLYNKNIDSRSIRLCGLLKKKNSNSSLLKNWEICWVEEKNKPVFEENVQITPGGTTDGYYGPKSQKLSIEVRDIGDNNVVSGIDVSQAYCKIKYLTDLGVSKTTGWIETESNGKSGAENTTLYVNVSKLEIKDMAFLEAIKFRISDLAGNTAENNFYPIHLDAGKPVSKVEQPKNVGKVNSLTVEASASDYNQSGIKTVTFQYRYKKEVNSEWSEWQSYSSLNSTPYVWEFKGESGLYQFRTVAEDIVGNREEKEKDFTAIFDSEKPAVSTYLPSSMTFDELPFEVVFNDDFKLENVYYRINKKDWTVIDSDIDNDTYTWQMSKEIVDKEKDEIFIIDFKVEDICGNVKILPQKGVKLYEEETEEAAGVYLDLSEFSMLQLDNEFTITASIPEEIDVENVKLFYRYSSDKKSWNEWKPYGGNKTTMNAEWSFKGEDEGFYEFKTKMWTTEGETIESDVQQKEINVFPVIPVILFIAALLALVALSLYSLLKSKKVKT